MYELHLGSWQRGPDGEWLGYRELAPRLVAHVRALGFTHVEFMPLTDTRSMARGATRRSATSPRARASAGRDLMFLIDELHRADIEVILDSGCPGRFPAMRTGWPASTAPTSTSTAIRSVGSTRVADDAV